MSWKHSSVLAVLACLCAPASEALGDAQWIGGGGDDLWSNAANWDPGIPQSATERHNPPAPPNNDNNVARFSVDGTTTLIQDGIDAVGFGVQIGHPKPGTLGDQSASNTLNMTGGTLTSQGNFLVNVGRGRNPDSNPGHLVQFNISGGLVNAAGITVPEAFNPDNVLGFVSGGLNAEMHVSGDAVVNTDLLRLGAQDSNSVVTISDNAQVNLTDDNNGFANGALWIEAFEDPVRGTSVLDIRDNGVLTVHGEWWTNEDGDVDENGNPIRGPATQSEADYIRDNYVGNGWIIGNGGTSPVGVTYADGVITVRVVPEPGSACLLLLGSSGVLWRRRR